MSDDRFRQLAERKPIPFVKSRSPGEAMAQAGFKLIRKEIEASATKVVKRYGKHAGSVEIGFVSAMGTAFFFRGDDVDFSPPELKRIERLIESYHFGWVGPCVRLTMKDGVFRRETNW